ncbi:MAG: radical SAM protein [Nitrospira sp. CG24A]|nr:MAG: radical SAM protein [Nitrospira sp. CG24A]
MMAAPLALLNQALTPVINLMAGRPVLATFQVNLRCNSACGYCDLPLNVGRYEMTREEIKRVFSGLYRDGVRFVLVQGGEPLLRRDLPEILEDLSAIGFHLTLITNGTKITASLVERLGRLPLAISVSLDTLDREQYRQIRGADQLLQVLEGIALLKEFPQPKFLTCIVSEVNRAEAPAVVRFAREQGFLPVVGAYHWNVGTYGRPDELLMYDRSSVAAVFSGLLDDKLIPPGYLRKFVEDNVSWLRGEKLEPCDAGRYSIAIDASGNVSPCLAFPSAGNLLESSLGEILARFDRQTIQDCSDRSSCNRLDGRVVGSLLRHPITALRTPVSW